MGLGARRGGREERDVTGQRAALVGALGSLLALGVGCGTTYQPKPSPRIGWVVHGGTLSYVQNGRETPVSTS